MQDQGEHMRKKKAMLEWQTKTVHEAFLLNLKLFKVAVSLMKHHHEAFFSELIYCLGLPFPRALCQHCAAQGW